MDSPSIEPSREEAELARRIAGAAGGSARAAETELYRCFAPRVRRYGLKHLRDEQAASDLMQQVLLLTIEALRAGKLRDPEQIGSFVFGTCRMVVLELRRGGARRERLRMQYADDVPIADASIAPRLNHERVARCLDGLAERKVRLREYRVPRNGSVNCSVAPEDEMVIARLDVPLGGGRPPRRPCLP